MPNLLAMSFEGILAPSFELRCLDPGRRPPDGWGVGFYPGEEPSTTVIKEYAPPAASLRRELVKAWQHLASSVVVVHIRQAQWGPLTDANTQPFHRSYAGRDWLFAHAGSLQIAPEVTGAVFEPVGQTDTERVFCLLMNRVAEKGWRRIADFDADVVLGWLRELDGYGVLNIVWTDGLDLLAYADSQGGEGTDEGGLYLWRRFPPYNGKAFGDDDLLVDLFKRGISSHRGLIVCSARLKQDGGGENWEFMRPGELIIARDGSVRKRVGGDRGPSTIRTRGKARPPGQAEPRRYVVRHSTSYHYETPVEKSVHLLRLTPSTDRLQRLVSHDLKVSVEGRSRDYDDVFGNRCRRLLFETPWSELKLQSESIVDVIDTDPLQYRPLRARARFPLVWMPWQHQMLNPYLLTPEMPESQLHSLTEYAMSFVRRNDSDLLETLLDINQTIFQEYEYKQGETTVHTSAYDVFENRRGVCQDFTNLFISLARLLGLPARYVCGYIYTGPKRQVVAQPAPSPPSVFSASTSSTSTASAPSPTSANTASGANANTLQSEASHAWVQLYLPELGWIGFDPTNGVVTQTDHIRVAVGRNYLDATPTSGTIYVGGGSETLRVDVKVELIG